MMPWIGVLCLFLGFFILLHLLGIFEKSKEVIDISRTSLEAIRNPGLEDEAKELLLQKNAIKLLWLSLLLTGGCVAAAIIPFGFVWLCSVLNLVSLELVAALSFSPAVLIGGGTLSVAALLARKKSKPGKAEYSSVDRLMHRVAFKTATAQIAIADVEKVLFSRELSTCKVERPVFITALPRAGTTLLLECCSRLPDLASHCYRDMPYVLIPCLWNRFSSVFKRNLDKKQRSHGDGMLIDLNSPEALEEVFWMPFWKEHYCIDHIEPWNDRENAEFEEFFYDHMRKIILLRREQGESETRYLSKNNLNIARIPWLRKCFPRATFIVPFRNPLQHATSLLNQHQNFLRIHKDDKFAYEYMCAIGHFDFGLNLRPIDFSNWFGKRKTEDATNLNFWVEYWLYAYRHLLHSEGNHLNFVHYETLCENPKMGLEDLANVLETPHHTKLLEAAPAIRPLEYREVNPQQVPSSLLSEVDNLYVELKKAAVNASHNIANLDL